MQWHQYFAICTKNRTHFIATIRFNSHFKRLIQTQQCTFIQNIKKNQECFRYKEQYEFMPSDADNDRLIIGYEFRKFVKTHNFFKTSHSIKCSLFNCHLSCVSANRKAIIIRFKWASEIVTKWKVPIVQLSMSILIIHVCWQLWIPRRLQFGAPFYDLNFNENEMTKWTQKCIISVFFSLCFVLNYTFWTSWQIKLASTVIKLCLIAEIKLCQCVYGHLFFPSWLVCIISFFRCCFRMPLSFLLFVVVCFWMQSTWTNWLFVVFAVVFFLLFYYYDEFHSMEIGRTIMDKFNEIKC